MIAITADGAAVSPAVGVKDCKEEPLLGTPKCSVLAVWQRVITGGAAADQRADINYVPSGGKAVWALGPAGKPPASFPDDCR